MRGYLYDNYGRVIGETVRTAEDIDNDVAPRRLYELVYNAKGQISELKDLANDRNTLYTYDVTGRLLRAFQPGISDIFTSYDVMNRVTATMYKFGKDSKTVSFNYGDDGRKADSTLLSGATRITKYDVLSRETAMSIGGLTRNIAYLNVSGNRTTTLPSSVTYQYGDGASFVASYTYDVLGNISTMTVDGVTYTYTYDGLNQLTAVSSSDGSYTASYTYDNGGNITSKVVNGATISYNYDTVWKDKLTSYNGQTITYDVIGNPESYRGMTMSWTGRRLDSLTNGSTTSFLYNSDGIRTRKTTGNIMTEYFLNGDVLVAEKRVNTTTQAIEAVIWYIYDDAGDILGLIYNGTPYYYLKNQQGDVISIVDADMSVVNSYTYDAWGKVMAITGSGSIGAINPIRYRGYYYDTESGLYYLQSRYYDPETGRFVNADDTDYLGASGTVLGYNLFAYCENNPVNAIDYSGEYLQFITGGILSGVFSIAFYVFDCLIDHVQINKWKVAGAFITGMASGILAATHYKILGQIIGNVIISIASIPCSSTRVTEETILTDFFVAVFSGIVSGIAGGNGLGQTHHLNRQTSQLWKRLFREPAKSITYFIKSNRTLYKTLGRAIIKSVLAGASVKYGKRIVVR